jgi:5'-3' exonuclease|tara:strand:- start:1017 stop:1850 length:834 start_codon:yes stop_codon:yes gene_type:complete
MILVDMNQISVASIMMHLHMQKEKQIDENMVRHMILNSIRMYRTKFLSEFGEIVLCYDSRHYWRRDYFPEYKHSRRKGRESDTKNWDDIFGCLNKIKEEIKNNMPYKFLEVYGAEADDIIATLCSESSDEVMILSGDKDFIQLQKYPNVKQYSPITKKMINGVNPDDYLKEHVLKGDSSDGVPNVLSPDNSFVDSIRQKPLSKKKIAAMIDGNFPNDEVKRNFQRNKTLIDLGCIPAELRTEILDIYKEAPENSRSKILNYFIKQRLKTLTESINEF